VSNEAERDYIPAGLRKIAPGSGVRDRPPGALLMRADV
jgi:hypothetical protein